MDINDEILFLETEVGRVKIRSNSLSPFIRKRFSSGYVEGMVGQTQIESLAVELWKQGLQLHEIVIGKEICPSCKRPL